MIIREKSVIPFLKKYMVDYSDNMNSNYNGMNTPFDVIKKDKPLYIKKESGLKANTQVTFMLIDVTMYNRDEIGYNYVFNVAEYDDFCFELTPVI